MKKNISRMLAATALLALLGTPLLLAEEGEGATLYAKKCALCHGKDGVAKKMAANSGNFNDAEWQEGITLETVVENIAKGKGKMPKNEGKLTPEQISAIAEYVKSM
jgi:cytochrome c6